MSLFSPKYFSVKSLNESDDILIVPDEYAQSNEDNDKPLLAKKFSLVVSNIST